MARTLLYDIETSYIISGNWGIWDQSAAVVLQDWQILCFAYKWLGEKKTYVVSQDDFKGYKAGSFSLDDSKVVKRLWELFNEADVVIAHNGNSFDQKKAQARMMVRKLPPPLPYAQIDTKLAVKRVSSHTSNRLNDLTKALEITNKIDAGGIDTWTGCMEGDPRAWKRMKKYNKMDVIALEELYLEIRPWIQNHPALNVLDEKPDSCPKCGGTEFKKGMKYKATSANRYQYHRCQKCGGSVKVRFPEPVIERMKYVN